MTSMEKAVALLKIAAETGIYSGLIRSECDQDYVLRRCRLDHRPSGTRLIFTRDSGHHSSGWWKNPDYERCYHLSLSFWDNESGEPRPFDKTLAWRWAKMFFGDHRRWVWIEPPYSPEGRRTECHHYRLFCDPSWQPIKPRGEVYSTELTEAGWKSFSEIHGEAAQQYEHAMGDPG